MARGYLLVDGYNIIFAWDELAKLAAGSMDHARRRLCDILCDYQGATKHIIIVVFDAHLVEGNPGSLEKYHNISIVFTKEAETADHYIEQTTRKLARRDKVTVATSDNLEQVIIVSHGALRMSAWDLMTDVKHVKAKQQEKYLSTQPVKNNPLIGLLDPETARKLEAMRYSDDNSSKK
ncbi:MAG: NYN domain-containing protein [Defluviitaleaceae bacterium]|nr:NYN domain-containing protein [Defluviitaleaceae bacterium]